MTQHDDNLQQIERGFGLVDALQASWERHFAAPDVNSMLLQQEGTHVPRPKKNKGYTPPESQPYIGIRTAMEILDYSKSGVIKVIKSGHIPSAYQVDGDGAWVMLRTDVELFKSEQKSNLD